MDGSFCDFREREVVQSLCLYAVRRIDVNSVKNTVFGKSLILIAEYDGPHGYSGSIEMKEWRFAENARSCNPFVYTPSDTSLYHQGWQAVSNYKVSDAWPKQMQSALKECPMPEEIADWLTNNIKIYFAYQCILPYKNNPSVALVS